MEDFVFELEENAKDTLIHGISHFKEGYRFFKGQSDTSQIDLKFSVLHVFNAVELFLKARLAKAHPTLIYEKPEKTGDDAKTVGFEALIGRLKSVGVCIDKQDHEKLDQLRKARNRIEHHRIKSSHEDVQNYIAKALCFLEGFLEKELKINLKASLDESDPEIYKEIAHCLESYTSRVVNAKTQAEGYGSRSEYEVVECECCQETTLVMPNPDTEEGGYCFLCDEEYGVLDCPSCHRIIFFDPSEIERAECDYCSAYALHNFEKA